MKKLLIIGTLCVAALVANAQKFVIESFINGTNLFVTNNSTVLFGATNVVYVDPQFIQRFSFSTTNMYPNMYDGTGTNRVQTPDQAQAFYYTNALYTTNSTGNLNSGAFNDCLAWDDRNARLGDASVNIVVASDGSLTNSGSTNGVVFTFGRLVDGVNPDAGAGGNGVWQVRINPLWGTTNLVLSTNVPAIPGNEFFKATKAIRLLSIKTDNSTTNVGPVVVRSVTLNGWVP